MKRRTFMAMIADGLFAVPLVAEAQPAGKVWRRIGMLDTTPAELNAANLTAFREGS